jgi:uncharacterized protein YciI
MKASLVILAILLPTLVVGQQKNLTPQLIQKEISRGKQYSLVLLKKGPNAESVDSVQLAKDQDAHLIHLFSMKQKGLMPIFGPLLEDIELRGICIFNITDKEEIKKLLDEDPHVKSGRLTYEIHSWFGLPGSRLPK